MIGIEKIYGISSSPEHMNRSMMKPSGKRTNKKKTMLKPTLYISNYKWFMNSCQPLGSQPKRSQLASLGYDLMRDQLGEVVMKGKKFGRWTVLQKTTRKDRSRSYYWKCKCDCGTEKEVLARSLKSGDSKSCGCLKKTPIENFFRQRYEISENGCWHWTGSKDKDGYGRITMCRSTERAHRYSYRVNRGEIPSKMLVCHTCDNPSCVNPDHLWLGTPKDNMVDKIRKGRGNYEKAIENRRSFAGENNPNCSLIREDVLEIYCLLNANECPSEIAREYGVDRVQIYAIRDGKQWKELFNKFMKKRR